ncbi:MAG: EamA family transporter RarD [Actinomycetes bacterium]
MTKNRIGLLFGISAYVLWGLFPLYWPLLKKAGSFEIVAHRAIWSLFFCLIALAFTKQLRKTLSVLQSRKLVLRLTLATMLVSVNWLTYIWAVNHGHIVDSALGYYINPLVMVGYGVLFLHEKLRGLQWVSVVVAFIGVIVLTIDYGKLPWISLTIAISWGSYGYVKKKLGLGSLESLTIETLISLVPYSIYVFWLGAQGTGQFGHGFSITVLLILAGAVTAIPLLLFNGAAVRLPFSIIGLLQFITPTLNFALGVWVKHEVMSTVRWIGFFVIWIALFALGVDLVKSGSTSNDGVAQGD